LPISFLRERIGEVAAAQSRLHMRYRNLRVKSGERCRHCGGRITLHKNEVGAAVCEATTKRPQYVARGIRERPANWFDVQCAIRPEPKRGQRGVADFAVLSRGDDADQKIVFAFS